MRKGRRQVVEVGLVFGNRGARISSESEEERLWAAVVHARVMEEGVRPGCGMEPEQERWYGCWRKREGTAMQRRTRG